MATFLITNLAATETHLGGFYHTLAAAGSTGDSLSLDNRDVGELSGMKSLQTSIADGDVSLVVTPTADEIASGLLSPPNSIQAADFAAVDATDVGSGLSLYRKAFAAGAGGSPADVVVLAVGALPYKMRIVDSWALVATNIGASTITVQDEAAGAGTTGATFDSATTGRKLSTAPLTSSLYTPGATKGLILRLSDDGVAGEVFVLVRREN